jgi:MFS family permease
MALMEGSSTNPEADFGAAPRERVRAGWIGAVSAANLRLLIAYFGPLAVLLPDQVRAAAGAAHKVIAFGWVTGLGAVVAVVANPLAGALSDRTPGRFGRRRPWALGGALLGSGALFLLAAQHTVAGIAVCWCLAQVGINAMQAAVVAAIPDRVPIAQRGVVSGWVGVAQSLSAVGAVVLVSKVVTGNGGYVLLGTVALALSVPYVCGVRDEPLQAAADKAAPGRRVRGPSRAVLRSLLVDPWRHRDFGWAWSSGS